MSKNGLRKFNHHPSGMIESWLGDYYYDIEVDDLIRTQQELITTLERSAALTQQNIMQDKANIATQQATIDRLTEQLKASQRELINWDDSLRISAELLGDSKPTRLPVQKIINMNKALIAEIEAGNEQSSDEQ